MCGIAGIFFSDSGEEASVELLTNMIHKLKHRGPDAQKTWQAAGVGLAHARLSIIDLQVCSDQPMVDNETGDVIVFNGEIYNYLEIKQDLLALGHVFNTHSDTEVILKAYAQWGGACQSRFNGMWAFVIYDKKNKRLFASRDRLGVKPFVFGVTQNNTLVFASEAKAIVPFFPEFNRVNNDFLIRFVERDFFACFKETFYQGLYNLLPGHYFEITHGQIPVQQRYWEWSPVLDIKPGSDAEIRERFTELLNDSIRLRFRSDVPVGSCLSGGMDSGTIVGLAKKQFNDPLHTFSCVFPNTPAFDESEYIQASVKHFNTIPAYVEPQHDDFITRMRDCVYEQDGPTGGPSVLSQRAVMELAGKHVKVVLDGQGADEVLGGYHSYFRYSLQSHARGLRRGFSFKKLINFYKSSRSIYKRAGLRAVGLPKSLSQVRSAVKFYTQNYQDTPLAYFSEFENDDLNTLLLEHVFTNLSNLLHYEDRNSMRFSVESRLPFLDYRLVEFAFSLTHHYKIRGSTTKWLLHHAAKDVLPEKVFKRKDKMGFTTPAHTWFLAEDNWKYFEPYFKSDNPIFSQLSKSMQNYLLSSYAALTPEKTASLTAAAGGDLNALWRFFTANLWHESVA